MKRRGTGADTGTRTGAGAGAGLVRRLRGFGAFWYDFVVGDDWRIALGVVLALGGTAALVAAGVDAWWLPPAAVVVLLALSLHRAVRR